MSQSHLPIAAGAPARSSCDVLICGAGPTGLVLALWLTRFGVRVRVVDKAALPGQTSRAVGVQARTLELYRMAGLADALVSNGVPLESANIWTRGRHRARVEFGALGRAISPYPYLLIYPQDEHEKLLIECLAAEGVHVERPAELVGVDVTSDGVEGRIQRADGAVETCHAHYLAGCDGARSFVRQSLRLDFPGGTYDHLFYVADVAATGPRMNGEAHLALDDDADFSFCFPLDRSHHARLIGTIRAERSSDGGDVRWEDISERAVGRLGLTVSRVNWFSTYHVHHRVAPSFRVGRAFLLGDAAHIHSPLGGQGMNTGIGDAINLAWKLAATLHDRADAAILDSFEEERVPFAQRLVATTDRGFELVTRNGALAQWVRMHVAPSLMSTLSRSPRMRRLVFRTISQVEIRYRGSRLSDGKAGSVHGGDRLPWIPDEAGRGNFEPLKSMTWQVHVYGEVTDSLRSACEAVKVPLHTFPWDDQARHAGFARDAAYLIRPDGYVALATEAAGAHDRIRQYLAKRGLRPGDGGRV